MGARLQRHLLAVQRERGCIGDVRGRGLMLGAEIVAPDGRPDACGARPADGDLARRVQAECLARGLIVELGGRHDAVVRFLPPLIVTGGQVDDIAERFATAVEAAERGGGGW